MTESVSPGRVKLQETLDRIVAEEGIPSVVAGVRDENGTWFGSAGVADMKTGRTRTPADQFPIGSGGKAFTAATMLTLEAEGRLSLSDTVEKWLPGVATVNGNQGDKITIMQLLTHTSGLWITGYDIDMVRKYHTRSGFATHRFDMWTVDELLKLAVSQPPIFEPGAEFRYTNGGYHLAGAIIEKVTGRSYEDEVDRAVIQPLGLTGTYARRLDESGFRGTPVNAYSRMFIRDDVDPGSLNNDNWESLLQGPDTDAVDVTKMTSWGWAAGGVMSTTGDMLTFTNAMINGSLLPPSQHRKMWTTVPTVEWLPNTRYGTGVSEWPLADGRTLHAVVGMANGSACFTMGTPDGEHTISMHVNNDWNWYPVFFQIIEAEFGSPIVTQR